VENPDAAVESGLTAQDQRLLTGALEYKDKQVLHVMTDLDKVSNKFSTLLLAMTLSSRTKFCSARGRHPFVCGGRLGLGRRRTHQAGQ
jgi:hypothetical protein